MRVHSRLARRLLTLLALLCLAALALGFLGEVSRVLDSLSHFRAHLAVLALFLGLLALPLGRFVLAGASIAAGLAALASVLPMLQVERTNAPNGAVYSLLQMNLRWDATRPEEAIRRIAEAQADIVTLQEMTPDWRARLAPLQERYPYQVHCPGADGFLGDSALLSRRPFVQGSEPVCDERNSFAEARIDFNGIAVSIASHHQLWPWPAGQWRRLDRLRATLEQLPAPVLIVGDFNAAPWSAFVQTYADLTDARVVAGIGPVWAPVAVPDVVRRTIGLPLNNVVASRAISLVSVARLESTSSDHLPLLLRFTLEAPAAGEPAVRVVDR